MKPYRLIIWLLPVIAAGCTAEDPLLTGPGEYPAKERPVYHAVIGEDPSAPVTDAKAPTKTFLDAGLNVLWNSDDRLTIFPDSTLGCEYTFQGEDGAQSGDLVPVGIGDDGTAPDGAALDGYVYAIYPHSEGTTILPDGSITYTFPGVQTYQSNSFGRGANVMAAREPATQDDLYFKNVLGYLSFKLWGNDVHVSSVILKANGGTPIAGEGTIRFSADGIPSVTMGKTASDKIRLYCDDILLGSSRDNCTEFWFALPPVAFTRETGGFTITVKTTDGGVFTQTASIDLTVSRKTVERMQPLKVVPQATDVMPVLNGVSSTRAGVEYTATQVDDALVLTIPTVTDFSKLVIDYDIVGDMLMVGGKEVISGVTQIDASKPLSLVVCSGDAERSFTFKARNTGLPVVRISTGDSFTLEDLELYQNSLQSPDGIDHRIWLPEVNGDFASISIENPDGSAGMKKNGSGAPVYRVDTKIKGRGNYTWLWDKKPYALKFDKKTEVLGMPAHKRWILLANWRDRTLLRNDAAFWLSRQAGLPYTVRGRFVELEINGEHRGNYYLCEQIRIDPNRVNITEIDYGSLGLQNTDVHTGGYLMEIDSYFDEVNRFKSNEFNLNYMFKEPEDDVLTQTDSLYMAGYINDFERILKTRSGVASHVYEDYLDVNSAILFMLVNELTGNRDFFQGEPHSGPHSTFLYKDAGGKLFMGPIWDFDYESFIPARYYNNNNQYKWRGFDNTGYYYYYLCYDSQFVQAVKDLWNSKKSGLEALTGYIDEMAATIGISQQFDEQRWPFHNEPNRNDNYDFDFTELPTYLDAIDRMKQCFTTKVQWMDDKINHLTTTSPNFPYQ